MTIPPTISSHQPAPAFGQTRRHGSSRRRRGPKHLKVDPPQGELFDKTGFRGEKAPPPSTPLERATAKRIMGGWAAEAMTGGDYKKAAFCYWLITLGSPQDWDAHARHGWALYKEGEHESAINAAGKAFSGSDDPDEITLAAEAIARSLEALDREEEAAEYFAVLAQLYPECDEFKEKAKK